MKGEWQSTMGDLAKHDGRVIKHGGRFAKHDGTLTRHDGSLAKHDGSLAKYDGPLGKHSGSMAKHDGVFSNQKKMEFKAISLLVKISDLSEHSDPSISTALDNTREHIHGSLSVAGIVMLSTTMKRPSLLVTAESENETSTMMVEDESGKFSLLWNLLCIHWKLSMKWNTRNWFYLFGAVLLWG